MFCPNCGTQIPEGAKFCPSCGAPTLAANAQADNNSQSNFAPQNQPSPFGGYKARIPFRNIATAILLSIVTCGIYAIIWMVHVVDELNIAVDKRNDTNGVTVWLLGFITCGIYTLFWLYNAGEKVAEVRRRNGAPNTNDGVIYLVLSLFGLGLVSYALIQNELNKVAAIV